MEQETSSEQHFLATESFSYSWLVVNHPKQPSSDESLIRDSHQSGTTTTTITDDGGGGGEFSQELMPLGLSIPHDDSNKPQTSNQYNNNFNFDFSISNNVPSSTSSTLVDADKLFSNGLIVPAAAYANTNPDPLLTSSSVWPSTIINNETASSSSHHHQQTPFFIPSYSSSSSTTTMVGGVGVGPFVSLSKTHQQSIFPRKFSRFSRKILQRYLLGCFVGINRGTRVDDFNRRALEVRSLSNTPETVSPPRMSTASSSAYYSSSWSDYNESSIYEAILYCKRSSGAGQ